MPSPSARTLRPATPDAHHERSSGPRTIWWIEALAATVVALVGARASMLGAGAATVVVGGVMFWIGRRAPRVATAA